jgi:hypothetical protein
MLSIVGSICERFIKKSPTRRQNFLLNSQSYQKVQRLMIVAGG